MNKYIGIGQIEERDPGAHATDPRGIFRGHSNGLTKREWLAGILLASMVGTYKEVGDVRGNAIGLVEDAVRLANNLLEALENK